MAQQMAKTPITHLLRIGWDTVGAIVQRVVGVSASTAPPHSSPSSTSAAAD
jgi:hypothetical protein